MRVDDKVWSTVSKSGLRVFAAACVIILATAIAWSQVEGSISGIVQDPSGAAVPNATVRITNLETGLARTVTTNERGSYRAPSLPVGRYEVRAEREGFRTAVQTGISLVVAQEAAVNLTLAVGDAKQQVTVTAEAPLVDTSTTPASGLVGEQQVKDLPLNGRSFDNLITLNPSTANTTSNRAPTSTGGGQGNNFSVSGNREDFNLFLMNGIEYTGASTADVIPGGVSGQLLGVDAVREFNVVENTYGAEYGKRPGGQISLVSMSGSNAFHGTLFEFLRNSTLDARNPFERTVGPGPFKRNQFGGSAGGPIRKDRTFVFGSYEGFRQRLALPDVTVVPDNNARQGFLRQPDGSLKDIGLAPGIAPYFSLWPVPNGPELGGGAAIAYSSPVQAIREDFGNVRVDQMISTKDSLFGAYTVDDGYNLAPGNNPLQQKLTTMRATVASVEETHLFSPGLLNTFRAGFSRAALNLNTAPAVNDPNLVFVQGQPVGSITIATVGLGGAGSFDGGGSLGSQQVSIIARNLFTFADDVSLIRGRHQFRFGGWAQRVQSNDNAADQRSGIAQFADLQSLMLGKALSVTATLNPLEIGWRQWAGAWYAQDTIAVQPNLTVTVGVRHEFDNGWNSANRTASNFVFGPGGILQTQPVVGDSVYSENNARFLFGPRVGVAWSPFGTARRTAIHAGFGIYYEQLDYMGNCCDASPLGTYNFKVTVQSTTFPIHLASGQPIPGARVAPAGVDPHLQMPSVQQYSFRVEQGLTANTVVRLGYVGEHGIHLLSTTDVNTAFPTLLPTGPFYPPKSPRRNPTLGNSRYELSNGISNYNALQLDLTHRFSHGLQFRANYTFSKSLDSHSSSFLANSGIGGTTTTMYPENPKLDWGRSNFDVTHRVNGNFSYELPFGRGKALLPDVNGLANILVSGWQLNSIITAQSGFPFTPLVGFNQSGSGDTRAPDRVSLNPNFSGPIIAGKQTEWFNPHAFLLPAAGTYGNAGRDILPGPGLLSVDASMFKNFRLVERANLQFRAEFFNLINHTNFGLPLVGTFTSNGNLSPSAGLINYTSTFSRELQFGLKLNW
ncbi:MAG TPA: carboxypeptidase-like regulatory domain-containing protein [Bryobacteraceae bacterium]|nr:carboxypeptidase-like regulatory domain-containing protein [Bryobacteraceae bacterium]